ncbi:MAG: ABC transporter permease [Acidobacteriota bacterium]
MGSEFLIEGRSATDAGRPNRAHTQLVSGDYFDTLGIPLLEGRAFGSLDGPGAPRVGVVSGALAERYWPGERPVGRRIRFTVDQPWITIVGVVGNVRRAWNDNGPSRALYLPYSQSPVRQMRLLLRTSDNAVSLLSSFQVGALAVDTTVFGALTLALLTLAALASYVPARRAARVDPVITLRAE